MATEAPGELFAAVLRRMRERDGLDALPAHLHREHGIPVAKLRPLDVGVFRVDRADAQPPLVARVFSAARPSAGAQGDLAALAYLAQHTIRAERPFDPAPLSTLAGQSVLVTEFVQGAPKDRCPPYPIVRLGAMIAALHAEPVPSGARRRAGALHHFAEGTLADELQAVTGWLESIEDLVPAGASGALERLRSAVAEADGGDGLPEGFVHPDPVPKNAVFTADGPVLVDWTAAGLGPRLPSMLLVLRSGWAARPFLKGYARRASLTEAERDRLAGLLFSRGLIDVVFRACRKPETLATQVRRLPALRKDAEAKAAALLDAI